MLISELGSQPDDDRGIESRGVSEQLAEMGVVCGLKLVLNDDHPPIRNGPTDDIDREDADRNLRARRLNTDSKRIRQKFEVGMEPRREVARLVGPNLASLDTFQLPQRLHESRHLVRH